ncbi:MAG: flagellar hook-associated protein FlgL [Rhodocyclaceae bacterium]|nr:flagellar hook-associated protein FlgL [Rhodocyclaceae bacterium]
MIRISTSMIYDAGVGAINRQSSTLLHIQQQVATGRRILTPADDPVNAARALVVEQSQSVVTQFGVTLDNARSALGLEEGQLTSVGELFARIKELTVQAGSATMGPGARRSVAVELRARFDELLGLANAADGQGQYLFSGYMGDTKPFGGTVDFLNAASGNEISYFGDDGQRLLQVAATRHLPVSDSGRDIFMAIRNGNGYFVTDYARNGSGQPTNTGTGVIDGGSITNPAAWNALINKNFELRFFVDNSVTPSVTYYDIVDTTANQSLLTGAPPAAPPPYTGLRVYQDSQPIELKSQGAEPPFDLGGNIVISGAPASGDSFTLAPSTTQSVFKTLAKLINALESNTATDADRARYANDIGFALRDFDQAQENVLRVRAAIGSRMAELDSLASTNADLKLQYQQTLSNLLDLDYAKAISDLTRKQVDLQAAQQSFAQTARLTLFDYLR